ncbi:hypothetical protein [Acidocella sp.]|uniref:hypothetical protein n=1 Tax=Acidocella sp. TaxID=50710 RepID=UPI002603CCF4|nr:hypothetical protein [Acidocella sp.]
MLRAFVLTLGLLLLLAGLATLLIGHSPAGLGALILGALITTGTIFERRYNPPSATPPAPGFEPTGETYIDPATGQRTETWFNPQTGERRYLTR